MIMISTNIVISLGMVGTLSIVRFRTAIKDPLDTLFYFWAIIEGLCVGASQIKLALVSSAVIIVVIIACSIRIVLRYKYLLIVRGEASLNVDDVSKVIRDNVCGKALLESTQKSRDMTELIYKISIKSQLNEDKIMGLMAIDGVVNVNSMIENGNGTIDEM